MPRVGGTIRTRWELNTSSGENRFQVRNARVDVSGNVASWACYYVNTDFCDRGKIKILDAWARITPIKGLSLQVGQFRMPFGVDTHRGPANYFFANRSFVGKQVCNYRAVGFKAAYSFAPSVPVTIEAGAFNPTSIGDHSEWNRQLAYSGKATLRLPSGFMASAGAMSLYPDSLRVNLFDAALGWCNDRWTVEGEYIYKHYTRKIHPACHSWVVFANYSFPLHAGILNHGSVQARYDGMTDHSTGIRQANGLYTTDSPRRQRLTLGATIGTLLPHGRFVDLRVDYEHYFFPSYTTPADPDYTSCLTAELVIHF